ncbi:hypothetical protein KPL74_09355 [Bacillus sp. NP157]|nr:hypothetical protein KPL74_09355 [Bacillus sp. NP157]
MKPGDTQRPAVVGFDVPRLTPDVDPLKDPPLIALLSCAPTAQWVDVFQREVALLKGPMNIADIRIADQRIEFFGSISDARGLSEAVRALVGRISDQASDERAKPSGYAASRTPTSFDRNR